MSKTTATIKRFANRVLGPSRKLWKNISAWTLLGWLISAIIGAIIGHFVDNYLDQSKEEASMARYYVASMPTHCHPKTSLELDDQIKRFIEASRRARADGRGMSVWREDCSIGANYSITLEERAGVKDAVVDTLIPAK